MTRPAGEPIGPSDDTALGPGILDTIESTVEVFNLHETARAKTLKMCETFYTGTHHDHLAHGWDGSSRDPGVGYLHERLRPQGFVPVSSIPYGVRKPDTHVPLGRQITNRFSELLLGSGRQPAMYVAADLNTERYLNAVFKESMMWDVLLEARDVAGACGSCAVVPAVVDGRPTAEVLCPYDLYVVKWKNVPGWEPVEVVEQRMVTRLVKNEDTGKIEPQKYWRTRLWTEEHMIMYDDVPEDWEGPIPYAPENKVLHHSGRCPVVWYQLIRNTKGPDAPADCDGVWHLLDQLDRLESQIYKAARANVDPTLHVKEEMSARRKMGTIQKGSNGSALITSPTGDAKYIEMEGTSITVGMDLARQIEFEILKTTECVIIDPEQTGQNRYQSGEAIRLQWRSMEAKANRYRVTIEQVIRELSRIFLTLGRTLGIANLEDPKPGEGIGLPPVVRQPDIPEDPDQVDRNNAIVEPQNVGTGAHVEYRWPDYWDPTPTGVRETAEAMRMATDVLSQDTRTAAVAKAVGVDPQEERARMWREAKLAKDEDESEFDRDLDRDKKRMEMEAQINGDYSSKSGNSNDPDDGDDE